VWALLLLLVAEDLVAKRGAGRGQVVAGVGLRGEAGLLEVKAGQDDDGRPGLRHVIDGCLKVAVTAADALLVEAAVVVLLERCEAGDATLEVALVVLAYKEVGTAGAVRRDVAGSVGKGGGSLVVGRRRHGE